MTKYTKEYLINIAKEHGAFMTSVSEWNKYATHNKLPTGATYSYHFGGWNNFKKTYLDSESTLNKRFSPSFTPTELTEIAWKHKEHFTTMKEWTTFALENNLPTSKVYIYSFDTWNKAKELLFGKHK
jgi:hypothetical protein